MFSKTLFLLPVVMSLAWAFPNGAHNNGSNPMDALSSYCTAGNFRPNHGTYLPQASPSPYVITVTSPMGQMYSTNQVVTSGNKDMTTFGWRYNNFEEEWPKFPPEFETCYSTMCDFSGASATVLAMYSSDKERVMFLVECASNEYESCHEAVCNRKGKWSLEGNHDDIQVSCVSDKCYRAETDSGAVHYMGSMSKSITGKSCIPWYNLPHVSPDWVQEYDNNIYEVWDRCRDKDRKSGVPWCYVSGGSDVFLKEVCDVAACVWDPLVDDT